MFIRPVFSRCWTGDGWGHAVPEELELMAKFQAKDQGRDKWFMDKHKQIWIHMDKMDDMDVFF
jgi:hypothetical protein